MTTSAEKPKRRKKGNPTSGACFSPPPPLSFFLYRGPNLFHFCTVDRCYGKKGYCGAQVFGSSSEFSVWKCRSFEGGGPSCSPVHHSSSAAAAAAATAWKIWSIIWSPRKGILGRKKAAVPRRSGDKKPSQGERRPTPLSSCGGGFTLERGKIPRTWVTYLKINFNC